MGFETEILLAPGERNLPLMLWGNSVVVWVATATTTVGLAGILYLARTALLRYLSGLERRKDTPLDRYLGTLAARIHPIVLAAVSVSLASTIPALAPKAARILALLGPLALLLQAALWGNATITFWVDAPLRENRYEDRAAATRATVVSFILRVALGSLALLVVLGILGFNITTLLASLGIGGIALALAIQNILGDLFASLSIALDKPFEVGDFIMVDDFLGPVEYVGLKTTRVRSLSGEQIVFSNADLLKSRIRNFKRMANRRVVFTFSVARETPAGVLEGLPEAIRGIVEAQEKTRFDRAHFKEFKETALVFEVVHYVLDPDMNLYMDIQQAINLEIHRRFLAEGIEALSPRRILYSRPPG